MERHVEIEIHKLKGWVDEGRGERKGRHAVIKRDAKRDRDVYRRRKMEKTYVGRKKYNQIEESMVGGKSKEKDISRQGEMRANRSVYIVDGKKKRRERHAEVGKKTKAEGKRRKMGRHGRLKHEDR